MNELVDIAILAYRAGRTQDAIELLEQVRKAAPGNALAVHYLALSYARAHQPAKARLLVESLSANSAYAENSDGNKGNQPTVIALFGQARGRSSNY
jgi:predicted Zn-dependent protease